MVEVQVKSYFPIVGGPRKFLVIPRTFVPRTVPRASQGPRPCRAPGGAPQTVPYVLSGRGPGWPTEAAGPMAPELGGPLAREVLGF